MEKYSDSPEYLNLMLHERERKKILDDSEGEAFFQSTRVYYKNERN